MKKKIFIIIPFLTFFISAHCCNFMLNTLPADSNVCEVNRLFENFDTANGWNSEGSNPVIHNGICEFQNASCGSANRVYKSFGASVSDNYWKAECKFSITGSNPSFYGTGAVVMALTAGGLDFMTNNNYVETNQDGIGVVIFSNSDTDNNIDNWFFLIEDKKGNVRNYSLSEIISASASISDYYIRMERSNLDSVQLSVFSDQSFTTHLAGSPITVSINSNITGLNTIQHGTCTPGNYSRAINAIVDNDMICEAALPTSANLFVNLDKFSLYPNPVVNKVQVILRENNYSTGTPTRNHVYKIYDVLGNLVLTDNLNLAEGINISALAEGSYLIEILNSSNSYWQRFIKLK